jgi:hypothetical protein
MNTLERSIKLLAVLKKREQTPEMLARIARVENDIKVFKTPSAPAPIPTPAPEIKKKKRIITTEIEVDE